MYEVYATGIREDSAVVTRWPWCGRFPTFLDAFHFREEKTRIARKVERENPDGMRVIYDIREVLED